MSIVLIALFYKEFFVGNAGLSIITQIIEISAKFMRRYSQDVRVFLEDEAFNPDNTAGVDEAW